MGDHILRRDVVAGDDIARQRDQSRNLFRMKGVKLLTPDVFCQPRFSSSMPMEVSLMRVLPRQ